MHAGSLLQSFALDNDGRVRSVEEVSRGLACDCVCPACLVPVVTRQGDVRQWHFAHEPGVDCPRAAETALHKAAKQLVIESTGMMLPEQSAAAEVSLPGGTSAREAPPADRYTSISARPSKRPVSARYALTCWYASVIDFSRLRSQSRTS